MDDIKKILKKYFTIIIIMLVCFGLLSNREHLSVIFSFWLNILSPFFYGIFIAYILSPITNTIKKFTKNKIISIVITYIIFLGIVLLLGFLCIPQIISSLSELITKAPSLYSNILNLISQYEDRFQFLPLISEYLDNFIKNISTYLSTILPNILNWITNILTTSFDLLVAIIMSIYLLFEKENVLEYVNKLCLTYLKKEKTDYLKETFKECEFILNKFIIGKAIDSAIIGILCAILMKIFNLDYIVLISLLVGITNMIPYIGPFIGGIFGFLLLLVVSPKEAFIFAILVFILQQFDGYYLGPTILGSKIGIKPLWIIISLLVGGALGGIIGMFLGTPIIAMINHLINKDVEKRLKNKKEELDS